MNVFWLGDTAEACARGYDDTRVNKGAIEVAQCISAGLRLRDRDPLSDLALDRDERDELYGAYNMDNALPHWAAMSRSHLWALADVTRALSDEYARRWDSDSEHGSWTTVKGWRRFFADVPDHGFSDPPFYGDDEYDGGDIISSYRAYYAYEKGADAEYVLGEVPEWWPDDAPRPTTTP